MVLPLAVVRGLIVAAVAFAVADVFVFVVVAAAVVVVVVVAATVAFVASLVAAVMVVVFFRCCISSFLAFPVGNLWGCGADVVGSFPALFFAAGCCGYALILFL